MQSLAEIGSNQLRVIAYKQPCTEELRKAIVKELSRRNKVNIMHDEWLTWARLFEEDVRRLEYRIQACYEAMCASGVPMHMSESFVIERIQEIIRKITS